MTIDYDFWLDPFYSGTGVELTVEQCQAIRQHLRAMEKRIKLLEAVAEAAKARYETQDWRGDATNHNKLGKALAALEEKK